MEFVKSFTPSDFQEKNFIPSILPNFNSFSKKKHKKWVKMEKFTLLAKILHCRRHWRHWQIPPLYEEKTIRECRTWYQHVQAYALQYAVCFLTYLTIALIPASASLPVPMESRPSANEACRPIICRTFRGHHRLRNVLLRPRPLLKSPSLPTSLIHVDLKLTGWFAKLSGFNDR